MVDLPRWQLSSAAGNENLIKVLFGVGGAYNIPDCIARGLRAKGIIASIR